MARLGKKIDLYYSYQVIGILLIYVMFITFDCSYMNSNPYKRNDRFQNNQKNGNYNHLNGGNGPGPSGMMKPKGDKPEDGEKPKRMAYH